MTREEKIAGAAELIANEYRRRGNHISLPDAVAIASKLYQLWHEPVHAFTLEPGEVAQKFRERYDGYSSDFASGSSTDRGQNTESD